MKQQRIQGDVILHRGHPRRAPVLYLALCAVFVCMLAGITGASESAGWGTGQSHPAGNGAGVLGNGNPVQYLRLVEPLRVHSVSTTSANLEWTASLPAVCELAWGETPECTNRITVAADCWGSHSLTGLEPGKTYYATLRQLSFPDELSRNASVEVGAIDEKVIRIETLKTDLAPMTYHVSVDGSDESDGLTPSSAWQTLSHAAARVRPGDTVYVGGGVYTESVRIRATGTAAAPITFRARRGERVEINGVGGQLNKGFIASGKQHLNFDGFYFKDFNMAPLQGWRLALSGEFSLYQCSDILIERCFSDGRGGYSARFVAAWDVYRLTLRNCVVLNKSSAVSVWSRTLSPTKVNKGAPDTQG